MTHKNFDKLLDEILGRIKDVLSSKSADYSANDDKLYNFKLSGKIDGISNIEALRGMWLKHRASITQGLDEILEGKPPRKWSWWVEKSIDDINYNILMLAMLNSGEL